MTPRFLICTDLDRTLIPNGCEDESPGARDCFSRFVQRPEITLVYVTGRDKNLTAKAIHDFSLPMPDVVIADVGTSIYMPYGGRKLRDCKPWQGWTRKIAEDWAGKAHRDLKALFDDLKALDLQAPHKQNDYKLSYTVALETNKAMLFSAMHKRLKGLGVQVNLTWSVDEVAKVTLLDVVPARATKYHAIDCLMQYWGFSIEETVFAGDSGNDLEVCASPIQSVLVANSMADVKEQAIRMAAAQGNSDTLYLAKGSFMGMNGCYSAGILEGIAHFLPIIQNWMEQKTSEDQNR